MSRTAKAVDGLKAAYEMVPEPASDEQPLMNKAIEDILAHAAEGERVTFLRLWLHIGADYMSDAIGVSATRKALKDVGDALEERQ